MESEKTVMAYFNPINFKEPVTSTSLYAFTEDHLWLYPVEGGLFLCGLTDYYWMKKGVPVPDALQKPRWTVTHPSEDIKLMDLRAYRAFVEGLENNEVK